MFQKGHKPVRKATPKIDSKVEKPSNTLNPVEELVNRVPKLYQNQYRLALIGKASYSKAIKMKCYECCGFEDVRERVPECTVFSCPLWNYRGGKRRKDNVSV